MRRFPGHVLPLCAALAGVPALAGEPLVAAAPEHTPHAEWDYSEQSGPSHWAELDPAYVLARVGGSQSPVDIVPGEAIGADLPPLLVEGQAKTLHMVNNGHTVEAVCPDGATFRYLDRTYSLRQFHFHAPSEHTVNGRHFEVELHFVFSDGEGHLAVLGVLFEEGAAEHPEIAALLTNESVAQAGDEADMAIPVDVTDFLPKSREYFTYDGSLTTPPATEGVRWFVFKEPLHLTRSQIAAVDRVYFSNNRPTQPLNARFVLTRR